MGCVYCATNKVNGKQYVGFTSKSLERRKSEHEKSSINNPILTFHYAIKKHGIENFEWEELFESNNSYILKKVEVMEIKSQNTKSPNGYNMTDGGDGLIGATIETRKKMGEANIGKKLSEKHRKIISKTHKGKVISPKTRKKMSKAQKKRHAEKPFSEETLNKMSESQKGKKRKPHSKKTRIKIGLGNKGKVSPMKGKKFTPIHRKRLSKSAMGNKNGCGTSKLKNRTYEEIYGPEKAAELKKKRREVFKKYWKLKNNGNKE